MFKNNNKNTRTTLLPFSSVSIVDFGKVNTSLEGFELRTSGMHKADSHKKKKKTIASTY